MTIHRTAAAALLSLAFVVSACGGGGATPTQAPGNATSAPTRAAAQQSPGLASAAANTTNACALVTQQEATTFLGTDPGAGIAASAGTVSTCSYGASLVVAVQPGDAKVQFDAKSAALKGQASFHQLTGVGDAAFATVVANTIADMEILKGSNLVSVLVQGNPSLQNITPDALQKLGAATAARL